MIGVNSLKHGGLHIILYINLVIKYISKIWLHFTAEGHIREGNGGYMDVHLPTLTPTSSPQFDPTHSGNVTALSGKTALLNCRVHNLSNKTVRTSIKFLFYKSKWIAHHYLCVIRIKA